MSIAIKQLSYLHPDKEPLFYNLSFSLSKGNKASLIGANGSGKSTLLRILSGTLSPVEGEILFSDKPYYVPQHFGQYNGTSIAEALGIAEKRNALHAILAGDASEENFATLNDDWEIEERASGALSFWGIGGFGLDHRMDVLSGGEKTKVFLSGMLIHSPDVILLDEPTNHLDKKSRDKLYEFILDTKATLLVVSHDRTLLNLLTHTLELNKAEIKVFGGNYEFYKQEKDKELNALQSQLEEKEKALRLAKKTAREALERQQKHDSRGEKQNAKKGVPRIAMGNLKSQAEKSTAKLKDVHSEKMQDISDQLSSVRQKLPSLKELKLDIGNTRMHKGKVLFDAKGVNFGYDNKPDLWEIPMDFQILSGERIAIRGGNGSGKTSLVNLILGDLLPRTGSLYRADLSTLYIDQEYSLLDNSKTVFEQIETFNTRILPEHELKMLLDRFVFPKETWDKKVEQLSGGEKMRLLLCCLQVRNNVPDVFILDEPTNNLDIQSLEILTSAVCSYRGTVVVISHDEYFLREIEINKFIDLD